MDKHTHISAGDKDLKPTFKKMCELATTALFDFSNLKISYSADDRKELEDSFVLLLEDSWLEDMYGAASTLQNDAWVERIMKEGKWVFDATEIRARLFAEAKIAVKHIN